jgi:hypothetical protein
VRTSFLFNGENEIAKGVVTKNPEQWLLPFIVDKYFIPDLLFLKKSTS